MIPGVPTGTSAAQKEPVTQVCLKCGALLIEDPDNCSFCDVPADAENASRSASARTAARSLSGQRGGELEWQREVTRRLDQYRSRGQRLHPEGPQHGLPFKRGARTPSSCPDDEATERPRPRPASRLRQTERMEICIQPEFDFSSAAADRARPQTALVPVASLGERRGAAVLDILFLALTCAGFLGLFRSLGGALTLEKMDAIVSLSVLYLFFALYFFLFTTFAGATPGMQIRGLSIVRLDGTLPDTNQLLWRSFGYLLSGATLLLGFLWVLWDEDHFTWQDRISQTYITAAAPLLDADPVEVRAGRPTLAHK